MLLGAMIRRALRAARGGGAAQAEREATFGEVRAALQRHDAGAARAAFDRLSHAAQVSAKGSELAGLIEYTRGRFDLASALFEASVAMDPSRPTAQTNLGQCLQLLGELGAAAPHLERARELAPAFVDASHNLALVRYRQQHLVQAEALCRDVLARDPARAQSHLLLAEVLLAQGRYAEAWPEFEWRRADARVERARALHAAPEWQGEALHAGDTLLVWTEQGYGDTLQFARFLPAAAARVPGVELVVACPEILQGIMRRAAGVGAVIAQNSNPARPHRQIPLLSLPWRLEAGAAQVRPAGSYLGAAPEAAARWAAALGQRQAPRVGLVWQSGRHPGTEAPELARNADRDIGFDALARALPRGRLRYLGMQIDHGIAPERFTAAGIEDSSGALRDFDDTAALLANLDLVITVDTAVAHLAAATGRPVWVLCKFDACWRWMKASASSDWYPWARRWFQHRPGDWTEVLRGLHGALERFGASGGEASG